jgi:hypothetical protein
MLGWMRNGAAVSGCSERAGYFPCNPLVKEPAQFSNFFLLALQNSQKHNRKALLNESHPETRADK